jgi:acetyltransferase-like isoleucine patch superfamily enzyme
MFLDMGIESIIKKIRGKVCSALAQHPVTHKWARFWWGLSGYSIGKNTRIAAGCLFLAWHHLDTNNIVIEDDASIGPRVMLIARTHPISQIETYGMVTSSIPGKIIIKKGAWIGAGVIILPNVTIGECAVVGAGAVVTKDVPAYTVAVGVPAKVIKKLEVRNETCTESDTKI